jgi:hypothetical protein
MMCLCLMFHTRAVARRCRWVSKGREGKAGAQPRISDMSGQKKALMARLIVPSGNYAKGRYITLTSTVISQARQAPFPLLTRSDLSCSQKKRAGSVKKKKNLHFIGWGKRYLRYNWLCVKVNGRLVSVCPGSGTA